MKPRCFGVCVLISHSCQTTYCRDLHVIYHNTTWKKKQKARANVFTATNILQNVQLVQPLQIE